MSLTLFVLYTLCFKYFNFYKFFIKYAYMCYTLIFIYLYFNTLCGDFPVTQMVKNLSSMQGIQVQSLGLEAPMEKGMATHSSILAWRVP